MEREEEVRREMAEGRNGNVVGAVSFMLQSSLVR